MASGRNIKVFLAKETIFGTAPASADSIIKITNIDSNLKQETKKSESKVGSRFSPGSYNVAQLGEITIDGEIYPDTVGYILKQIANNETVSVSGGGYKHTFTPTDTETATSWTIQEDLAGLEKYNYLGSVFDELNIDIKTKDFLKFSLKGNFQDKEIVDPYGEYTGTYSTLKLFVPETVSVKLDGSATTYTKNISLNIKNGLVTDDYRLNSTNMVAGFPLGEGIVSGSIEFTTDLMSETYKYDQGTSSSLEITLLSQEEYVSGEYYKIVIKLPYIFYQTSSINRDNNLITIKLDFEAFDNGSDSIYTIELYDKKATEY